MQALALFLSRWESVLLICEVGKLVSGSMLAVILPLVGSLGEPERDTPSELPVRSSSG